MAQTPHEIPIHIAFVFYKVKKTRGFELKYLGEIVDVEQDEAKHKAFEFVNKDLIENRGFVGEETLTAEPTGTHGIIIKGIGAETEEYLITHHELCINVAFPKANESL